MFHKEGAKIILGSLAVTVAIVLLAEKYIANYWLLKFIEIFSLVFLILILQFFRNPKRPVDAADHTIIAPVDGKIVVIEEVYEPEYFKEKRLQVSIFMSPINVHVTRYAVNGLVKFSKYLSLFLKVRINPLLNQIL